MLHKHGKTSVWLQLSFPPSWIPLLSRLHRTSAAAQEKVRLVEEEEARAFFQALRWTLHGKGFSPDAPVP